MARPRQTEQRDTRGAILAAGLDLFAERGFHGTSIRDIAKAVAISEASLYHHFASKELLLDAVLFEPDAHGRPAIAPPIPPPLQADTLAELAHWLDQMLQLVLDRFADPNEVKRFRILLSDGLRLAAVGKINYSDKMFAVRQVLLQLISDLQDRGMLRPGDAEHLAMEFIGPVMMWRHMLVLAPESVVVSQRVEFARRHVRHFLRAACTHPADVPGD